MRLELSIGLRYLRPKKKKGFLSFNFFLSTFIVALGVFILIVVISVMGGFQKQIKDTLLQADAHILIRSKPKQGRVHPIKEYREIAEKIRKHPKVQSALPFIKGDGLLRKDGFIKPVQIRGVPIDPKTRSVPDDMKTIMIDYFGDKLKLPSRMVLPKGNSLLVGYELKNEFTMDTGSKIELIVPKGDISARIGLNPVIETFRVKGFFKTGYYTYDSSLVYLSMRQAGRLYGIGDKAYGIAVKIDNIFNSKQVRDEIIEEIGLDYMGFTIEDLNENLFTALQLEKGVMSILLFLIIVAAAFNITGTLIWVVMDKRKAIGILKAMGASSWSIMMIFIFEGFFIGIIGTFFGVILGTITADNVEKIIGFAERNINIVMSYIYKSLDMYWSSITIIPPIYYVDGFPSTVEPNFVIWISIVTVFITTMAGLMPAWQAAKLHPVETMRYE